MVLGLIFTLRVRPTLPRIRDHGLALPEPEVLKKEVQATGVPESKG